VIATIECSACGGVHEWTKHDVWLSEGGEHYREAAAVKAARPRKAQSETRVNTRSDPVPAGQDRGEL
jgi:hypothetical protein